MDVFEILLKDSWRLILALAQGMMKQCPDSTKQQVENGRLLVIAPFEENVASVSSTTIEAGNRHIINLSDKLVMGYAKRGGVLEKMLAQEVWHSLQQ